MHEDHRTDAPRRYFAPSLPRNIAHRGLATAAPENTIAAFRAALQAGATHLETDVHGSSDGIAVISHDPDLRRVLGRSARIDEFSMSQLAALDLGGGNGFVSLLEALESFPEARFNIDIKSEAAVPGAIAAIRSAGATDRVLVVSFDEDRRTATIAGLPGVATAASSFGMRLVVLGVKLHVRSLVRRGLHGVDAVQVPERYGRIRVVTPPWCAPCTPRDGKSTSGPSMIRPI